MIKTIINRDGTKAKFELWRVETAIEKALHSCTGKDKHLAEELTSGNSIPSLSKNLASEVYSELKEYLPGRIITVELVQNTVERILMKKGYYVVAKEYILYRDRHARIRKQFLCTESAGQINAMNVIKRSSEVQPMSRDKILKRIRRMCEERSPILKCDPVIVAEKVAEGVYDGVTTRELDELTITIAKNMVIQHPDYEKLAARIAISGHQKDTDYHRYRSIPEIDTQIAFVAWSLFHNTDQNGDHSPLLRKELYEYIIENQALIDEYINYEKDFDLSIFGFQTLTRAYLLKACTPDFPKRSIVERPQDLFMRVALGIHCVEPNLFLNPSDKFSDYEKRTGEIIDDFNIASKMLERRNNFVPDLDRAFQTYSYMSRGYFIHATPTLFYAGTPRPGLSSCFLIAMDSDSIDGIYKTLKDCALISKNSGGIGIHIHKIRANQSYIRGTGGDSDGIVPMLGVYNDTAKYVNQGGKRKGAFAVYLSCYHADILDFLELKLPHGQEHLRCRDLFYAFWRNDYFMECVLEDRDWYLMCPDECPGLAEVYGEDFVRLYEEYIEKGKYRKVVKAREVYQAVIKSRVECGVPYIGEKDSINRKSNQSNLGVIQSSNLCVSGDTYILTKQFGQVLIEDVVDQVLDVWNGEEWSETTIRQTGENKDLLKVTLSNGAELNCTPEHRFYIQKAYRNQIPVMIEAKDLPEGCKLIKYNLPSPIKQENIESFSHAYTHGFFCGDGIFDKKHTYPRVFLHGKKKELLEKLVYTSHTTDLEDHISVKLSKDIKPRFLVPLNASISDKLEWLAGYADAIGTIVKNGTKESLHIPCIHKNFLLEVRLMLQTLGIDSKITLFFPERKSLLSDDKEARKEYDCTENYKLLINSSNLFNLYNLGFCTYHLKYNCRKPQGSASQSIRVVKVEEGLKGVNTYCFTEEKRHMGMFNGILTGQCTEIALYSDPCETAVCNLASIALSKFVENDDFGDAYFNYKHLHEVAQIVTRNINKVIDRNYYPTKESERSNYRHRPIGIGVQGLWDVFMMLRVPFGSPEAIELDKTIFETIYHGSLTASWELAREEGCYSSFWFDGGCPLSKGLFQFDLWAGEREHSGLWDWEDLRVKVMRDGIRNSELLAPMPTASTSQILGNVECLVGKTPVTLRSGLSIPIEDMKSPSGVIGVCDAQMQVDKSVRLIDQGMKDTITLVFSDGREIQCTPNHKFQLSNGKWKEASKLDLNSDKICVGLEPIIDNQDFVTWTWEGKTWNRTSALALARIIGYVGADGCVYRHKLESTPQVTAYLGCQYDVENFVRDIELVGGSCTVGTNKESQVYEVRIHAYISCLIEKALGSGRRATRGYQLPDFITDLHTPLSVIREYMAGHFGGDGHRPNLVGSELKGVKLCHYIHRDKLPSLRNYFAKLKELLHKIGVEGNINIREVKPTSKSYSNKDVVGLLMELATNTSFATKVGFRYSINKSIKLSIANSYWRIVEKAREQRSRVVEEAKKIRETEHLSAKKSIEKSQKIIFANEVAINKYAMANPDVLKNSHKTKRLGRCGISPREYVETFEAWNEKYCCDRGSTTASTFYLHLIDRKESGKQRVWDITVEDTHAFFANGVAVHNCFEPIKSNLYKRKTSSGEFIVLNKYLYKDIEKLGLDVAYIREQIEANGGSVQKIEELPIELKELYKTVWDMDQTLIVDHCASRGPYVSQCCSMNLYFDVVDPEILMKVDIYSWMKGIKTQYYTHSRSLTKAKQHHSSDNKSLKENSEKEIVIEGPVCRMEEGCLMCGS